MFTRRVRRLSPGGFTTPDPYSTTPKSIKWENRSKLGIRDPFGGKKKSSFGGQLKSPSSEGKTPGSFRGRYPSTGPLTPCSTFPAGVVYQQRLLYVS